MRWIGILLALATASATPGAIAEEQYEWLRLDRYHVKWGAPVAGSGSVVTYAYVREPIQLQDARNCRDMRPLDAVVARSQLTAAMLEAEFEAALAMWQAVADIRFHRADSPSAADILVGAQAIPEGVAFADVAYGEASGDGMRSIRRSLVCLNPEKRWTVAFDGDPETYDLRYAFAHEIGHAIGLDHPGPSGQLMSFRYEERFRELQPGDIAGAVGLYGARLGTVAGALPSTDGEHGDKAGSASAECRTVLPPRTATALAPPEGDC